MTSLRREGKASWKGWRFGWVLEVTQDLNIHRWGGSEVPADAVIGVKLLAQEEK